MPEEVQDVNSASSTEEQVVNQEAVDTTQQPETVEVQPQEQTPQQPDLTPGQVPVEEIDEMGVPWKNRAMEANRKLEKALERLEGIEQKITQQQPQQRTYSIGELRVFANDPNTPSQHKIWAENEIARIEEDNRNNAIKKVFTEHQKEQTTNMMKQQSLEYVKSNYSDCFVKDTTGNIMGWNPKHPLTQQIALLMQNPELQNNPQGLAAAADIAFGRLARRQIPQTQQQQQNLKREIKTLQKGTLVEGGGKKAIVSKSPQRAAFDKAKQTGTVKDSAVAIKELLKATGMIEGE